MSTTPSTIPAAPERRVEQAQRAALKQIATLAEALPVPLDIYRETDGGLTVLFANREELEPWLIATDAGRPTRTPAASRAGMDRAEWAPEGVRLFTIVGYIASLPKAAHLTAVQA